MGFTFSEPPHAIASLPAKYPKLGRLEIYDDGHEATVCITEITHGHFSSYDDHLTVKGREEAIAGDVTEFLEALFADRVLLYRTPSRSMGGWTRLDISSEPPVKGREYFLWSHPFISFPN